MNLKNIMLNKRNWSEYSMIQYSMIQLTATDESKYDLSMTVNIRMKKFEKKSNVTINTEFRMTVTSVAEEATMTRVDPTAASWDKVTFCFIEW